MHSSPSSPATARLNLADRLFAQLDRNRAATLAFFACIALATRCAPLGDWNYEVDVQFFMLVGDRLRQGALLYVDVWDRKPPALYLIYALAGLVSRSVISIQLVAAGCTALAAYGIHRIARTYCGAQGGIAAGVAYCALVTVFGGLSAQSAVLYNPLMVACAWSLASSAAQLARGELPLRAAVGLGCAGLALAFKQAALTEGVGFGLLAVWLAWRGGTPPRRLIGWTALLAAAGALPMPLAAGWYAATGHFAAFWQALVLSNGGRVYDDAAGMALRYLRMLGLLAPTLLFAVLGYRAERSQGGIPLPYRVALGWLAFAALGVAIYPALVIHYALPLLAPLCLLAAPFFARRDLGLIGAALLVTVSLAKSGAFDFASGARSRDASSQLAAYVRSQTPHHRLFLFDHSPWLYALAESVPPTPLLFPSHLFDGAEAGAVGRDPTAEVRRVLAWQPEAVVLQEPLQSSWVNQATVALVAAYARRCPQVRRFTIYDHDGPQTQLVYSGCAPRLTRPD